MKTFSEWLNLRDAEYFDETFRRQGGRQPIFQRQPGRGLLGRRRVGGGYATSTGYSQQAQGGQDDDAAGEQEEIQSSQRAMNPNTGTLSPQQYDQISQNVKNVGSQVGSALGSMYSNLSGQAQRAMNPNDGTLSKHIAPKAQQADYDKFTQANPNSALALYAKSTMTPAQKKAVDPSYDPFDPKNNTSSVSQKVLANDPLNPNAQSKQQDKPKPFKSGLYQFNPPGN